MADEGKRAVPAGLNAARVTAAAMVVGGFLLLVVSTVWLLVRLWQLSQVEPISHTEFLVSFVGAAALMFAGWGFCVLLWGLAEILRKLADVVEASQQTALAASTGGLTGGGGVATAGVGEQTRLLTELIRLTREVRDIGLLSEADRAHRLQAEASALIRQLEAEIPVLLQEHRLQEAHERLQRARARFPKVPNWDVLAEKVEQTRAKFEAHDLETATREVEELISLGAWERANDVVQNLQRRHPNLQKAGELSRRVAKAREQATAEERARLMSQAQDATNRRDWSRALELVQTVMARYPNSLEAHDLRQQLPTLRANAEIQRRQEMETRIRDLIKEHRYTEALTIARQLIARYPDSPQAGVLREQLPRLEQKAGG